MSVSPRLWNPNREYTDCRHSNESWHPIVPYWNTGDDRIKWNVLLVSNCTENRLLNQDFKDENDEKAGDVKWMSHLKQAIAAVCMNESQYIALLSALRSTKSLKKAVAFFLVQLSFRYRLSSNNWRVRWNHCGRVEAIHKVLQNVTTSERIVIEFTNTPTSAKFSENAIAKLSQPVRVLNLLNDSPPTTTPLVGMLVDMIIRSTRSRKFVQLNAN